jgi:D-alanine-D-alanine ligase
MRVALLHNAVPPDASPSDRDVLIQVEAVSGALALLGHEPIPLPCSLDLESTRLGLTRLKPDLVFNLVESLSGSDWLQGCATALLDVMGLPYTGSPTAALFLTNHKPLAKQWLRQARLPTPDWLTADPEPTTPPGAGPPTPPLAPQTPYIIKPVREHASAGMNDQSVVRAADSISLRQRVRDVAARSGVPLFAERYIEGREFNLSVLAGPEGPEVLPPAEIDFSAFPADKPRIVGYEAKWADDSFEFRNTPRRFDFTSADRPLLADLCRLAESCWQVFGLRGFVRVDFRVDEAGGPWILEINANPCLSPDAGFAAALEQAGIGFDRAVQRIIDDALAGTPGHSE